MGAIPCRLKTMNNRINILKTELQKSTYADLIVQQNYPAIASILNNAPLIPNPLQQSMIWNCPSILELFAAITPNEALQIYQIPNFVADIRMAIDQSAKDSLFAYLEMAKTLISETSRNKLENLLGMEQPDPNYQPQILGRSIAETLGIYPVSESEIQEALN